MPIGAVNSRCEFRVCTGKPLERIDVRVPIRDAVGIGLDPAGTAAWTVPADAGRCDGLSPWSPKWQAAIRDAVAVGRRRQRAATRGLRCTWLSGSKSPRDSGGRAGGGAASRKSFSGLR